MCSMEKELGTTPRSFARVASGRVLPSRATRFVSSRLCVIRGRACAPDSICAVTEGAATRAARTTAAKNPSFRNMGLPLSLRLTSDTPRDKGLLPAKLVGASLRREYSVAGSSWAENSCQDRTYPNSKTTEMAYEAQP